jgi:putative methionine-R-sulfoxide reductase with GAF domain
MWEFGIRLGYSIGTILLAATTGILPLDAAVLLGSLTAAYAVMLNGVDRKDKTNPGIAGLGAGLDSLSLAAAMSLSGVLPSLGLVVLLPVIYATARRGSNPLAVGSIAAAAVLFAGGLTGGPFIPEPLSFAQAGIVWVVSVLLNQPRLVVRPKSIREMIAELPDNPVPQNTQALIELREKYRRVASTLRDVERKSRISRVIFRMLLSSERHGDLSRMIERLCSDLGATGAILYTVNQVGDRLIVAAHSGATPSSTESLSLEITGKEAAHLLREKASQAIRSLNQESLRGYAHCNVLLKSRGKVIGLLTLFSESLEKMESLRSQVEEASEAIARVITNEKEWVRLTRRALEAEMLYEIACRTDGAISVKDLCKRVCYALSEIVQVPNVGIYLLESDQLKLIAKQGKPSRLFESILSDPVGVEGWLRIGAPQINAYDTSQSTAIDRGAAVRERTGSFMCAAIRSGEDVLGLIVISSPTSGKLGPSDARIVCDVAAEIGHSITATHYREKDVAHPWTTFLTPNEFQHQILSYRGATMCLAHVVPLRFEELEEELGRATIEIAIRQLGLIIRRFAPTGASVSRKGDDSYLVLLPNMEVQDAERWANNLAAQVSLRSFISGDHETVIPLAVRVRIADLNTFPKEAVA